MITKAASSKQRFKEASMDAAKQKGARICALKGSIDQEFLLHDEHVSYTCNLVDYAVYTTYVVGGRRPFEGNYDEGNRL